MLIHASWANGVNPAGLQDILKKIEDGGADVQQLNLLRAPGGEFPQSNGVYDQIDGFEGADQEKGIEGWYYYKWTINSCDALHDTKIGPARVSQPENIIMNLKAQLEKHPENPIILLHSIKEVTRDAIANNIGNPEKNLISALEAEGYTEFNILPREVDSKGFPPIWD